MNVANLLATKGRPVITTHPLQSVRAVVTLLAERSTGALVVVDEDGRTIGIVAERHIVRRLAADDQTMMRAVGEIMARDVITATPQDDLTSILQLMTERRIRHVPVTDRGELVGIVSLGDVLKFQRDQYRGAADTLETQVMGA